MSSIRVPFADFFNITMPVDVFPLVLRDLLAVFTSVGGELVCPGFVRLGEGAIRYASRGSVGWLSVSGRALGSLRASETLLEVLGHIGSESHRVSTLHVAFDVPEPGPSVVGRLYRRGKAGYIRLTQKPIPRGQVTALLKAGVADGRSTGTVYLGSRKRDVFAAVYDKRDELLCRAVKAHGPHQSVLFDHDPGPLTRFELRLGRKVGASLRDVVQPAPLFWHFMGASLGLHRPVEVPAWCQQWEGFTLEKPKPRSYVELVELWLENSAELKRMVAISDQAGLSRAWLCRRIERMVVSERHIVPMLDPLPDSASSAAEDSVPELRWQQ